MCAPRWVSATYKRTKVRERERGKADEKQETRDETGAAARSRSREKKRERAADLTLLISINILPRQLVCCKDTPPPPRGSEWSGERERERERERGRSGPQLRVTPMRERVRQSEREYIVTSASARIKPHLFDTDIAFRPRPSLSKQNSLSLSLVATTGYTRCTHT